MSKMIASRSLSTRRGLHGSCTWAWLGLSVLGLVLAGCGGDDDDDGGKDKGKASGGTSANSSTGGFAALGAETGGDAGGSNGGDPGEAPPEVPTSGGTAGSSSTEPALGGASAGQSPTDTGGEPAAGGTPGTGATAGEASTPPPSQGGAAGTPGSTAGQAGTGGEEPDGPTVCEVQADCVDGTTCEDGICVAPASCEDTFDCAEGEGLVCSDEGQCVQCLETECAEGQRCLGNACREACDSDLDCVDAGLLCNRDRGFCVPCVEDDSCPEGARCRGSICVTQGAPPGGGEGGAGGGGGGSEGGEGGGPGCGNGTLEVGEACDDGNTNSDDGCSDVCRLESGFTCGTTGDQVALPITYRDFAEAHPDFQPDAGGEAARTGLVTAELDDDGKPVLVTEGGAGITTPESFADWYRDTTEVNATTDAALVLYRNGDGAYVNRSGENGEGYTVYEDVEWCAGADSSCEDCGEIPEGKTCGAPCPAWTTGEVCHFVSRSVDGDPLFFPIDEADETISEERYTAVIPPPYAAEWTAEPGDPRPQHNFHFTSELRFWFTYDSSQEYSITFAGDDDAWVFINGQLAVDLGGLHPPLEATISPNEQAEALGLVDGEPAEVVVFHAERKTESSTYRLGLSGFTLGAGGCQAL